MGEEVALVLQQVVCPSGLVPSQLAKKFDSLAPLLALDCVKVHIQTQGAEEAARAVRLVVVEAVGRLNEGAARTAADLLLGIGRTRGLPRKDRRREAADALVIGEEHFRKRRELLLLKEVAEEICALESERRRENPEEVHPVVAEPQPDGATSALVPHEPRSGLPSPQPVEPRPPDIRRRLLWTVVLVLALPLTLIAIFFAVRSGDRDQTWTDNSMGVALGPDGLAVEVHKSQSHDTLWYHLGRVSGDTIIWGPSHLYENGATPSVALGPDGLAVEVHKSQSHDTLWYHLGRVSGDTIIWGPSHLYENGATPSVVLGPDGLAVEVHKSQGVVLLVVIVGAACTGGHPAAHTLPHAQAFCRSKLLCEGYPHFTTGLPPTATMSQAPQKQPLSPSSADVQPRATGASNGITPGLGTGPTAATLPNPCPAVLEAPPPTQSPHSRVPADGWGSTSRAHLLP